MNAITTISHPGYPLSTVTRLRDPSPVGQPSHALGLAGPDAWRRAGAFLRAFEAGLDDAREMVADDAADPPDANTWHEAITFFGDYAAAVPPPLVCLLQLGGLSVEWHEHGLNIEARFRKGGDRYVVVEDAHGSLPTFHGRENALRVLADALGMLAHRTR